MNGHNDPELFDPIAEFNLADDPAYLEYSAKIAGEHDGINNIPLAEGLAIFGDASSDEQRAYLRAYLAAGLRRAAMRSGVSWYDIDGVTP